MIQHKRTVCQQWLLENSRLTLFTFTIKGEPVPGWGRHLWKLWRYRLSYALRQTQLGRSIFLVDVDTMWNRYVPLDALFAGSTRDIETDVFLSQGTVYPPDVYDKWGFVGCMGSVAFRATPGAQTLLRQAIRTCAEGKGLSQSPRSASANARASRVPLFPKKADCLLRRNSNRNPTARS